MKNSQNLLLKNEFKNKTVLITGGAGSLGSALTKKILEFPVDSVRILDINEHSLFQLNHSINDSRLRILLGSIVDKDRIDMATKDTDIIFHVAAIKNIEISEFNPFETVEININGTMNLLKTTMMYKPKKFLYISTDKAVDPSTLYGSTKQISERLVNWAYVHNKNIKFSTIRFGNIMETRGNVFELWRDQKQKNLSLSITDPKMKRYFFHMSDAVDFILQCLLLCKGGDTFVPKMSLYSMNTLANQISHRHKVIGRRKGEKLCEKLMSDYEKSIAIKKDNMWIIRS